MMKRVFIYDDLDDMHKDQRSEYKQLQNTINHRENLAIIRVKEKEKDAMYNDLILTKQDIVIGPLDFVFYSAHFLNVSIPKPDDYPKFCFEEHNFNKYIRRKIGICELQEALYNPIRYFVKPYNDMKVFTGTITRGFYDISQYMGVQLDYKVWFSEIVNFVKEYRCFVLNGQLQGFVRYRYNEDKCMELKADAQTHTNAKMRLNIEIIRDFVKDYETTGTAPKAYVVDFGVLDTGETVLIECNDGFSFGTYSFNPEICLDMMITRWNEIMQKHNFKK